MSTPSIRFSIVVPMYNAAATLARALQSLVDQDYPELEIICVDGASTDSSMEIVSTFGDAIAAALSEPDEGQADALNKGFALARGNVFGWLCADDELMPNTLHRVAEHLQSNQEVDILTGGCQRIFTGAGEHTTVPDHEYYVQLFIKNTIEQPSTFWRAETHRQVGPLSLELKYAFDWEYWCRMKQRGARFMRTDDIYSVYYFSSTNLTSTGGRKIADEMYRVIREYGPYNGKLAWAFAFLYRTYDLRGFYDTDAKHSRLATLFFHLSLRTLYLFYDRTSVNLYNWNFASRQERGLSW
ncbi:MAG: glycosyltransferase family 2 protein [Pseudomonadota bacterium]